MEYFIPLKLFSITACTQKLSLMVKKYVDIRTLKTEVQLYLLTSTIAIKLSANTC